MAMAFLRILTVLAAVMFAGSALGWNDRGHMMVAAIAWDQLDDATQKRVVELLKRNPEYQNWVSEVPKQKRHKVAFVKAATWADLIKQDEEYVNDGNDPSKAPAPKQNIGYDDKFQHRYWHYIDLPFSPDGTALIQPKEPNAQTQIENFRDALASEAEDDIKSYDLVWLLHLVGDVHQPLHATSRFLKDTPKGDEGGNDVVICDPQCGRKLHAFWDGALGQSNSVNGAIFAADKLDEAPLGAAANTDVRDWIEESFAIAKTSVYVFPIKEGRGPFNITSKYREAARTIAEQRVALAGTRLAKLLNDSLK
jgi:hypothetical protein